MKDDLLTLYSMMFISLIVLISSIYIRFNNPDLTETQIFLKLIGMN